MKRDHNTIRYLVAWTGGYEQPSFSIEKSLEAAMTRVEGWRADMNESDQIDVFSFGEDGVLRSVGNYTIDSEDDNG